MSALGHLTPGRLGRASARSTSPGWLVVSAGAATAIALGGLIAVKPLFAVGAIGFVTLLVLPFAAPVTHLMVLLAFTAIVPYSVQKGLSVGPGLGVADVLVGAGLLRALLVLGGQALERRQWVAWTAIGVFLAVVAVQTGRGLFAGEDAAQAAYEGRVLMSWCTLLIAMPIVSDPAALRRLLKGGAVVGLLVGLWGLAQWMIDLPFGAAGDAGVRAGVRLTTSGRGQVQGALFAFPVAALLAFAVLVSGQVRSMGGRLILGAVLLLNLLSLVLTFERTFYVALLIGIGFVLLRAGTITRLRALAWLLVFVVLTLPVLSTVAPGALTTARERVLSIGQYGSDNSVRFRVVETRHVVARIADQPVAGSGLGATIHWGRPYEQVKPQTTPFAHNALLWLAWKVGIPATLLLLALVLWAISTRAPPRAGGLFKAVRDGAQAALLVMLIVSVTFPSFAQRPITPVLGVLLAICLAPRIAFRAGATEEGRSSG